MLKRFRHLWLELFHAGYVVYKAWRECWLAEGVQKTGISYSDEMEDPDEAGGGLDYDESHEILKESSASPNLWHLYI